MSLFNHFAIVRWLPIASAALERFDAPAEPNATTPTFPLLKRLSDAIKGASERHQALQSNLAEVQGELQDLSARLAEREAYALELETRFNLVNRATSEGLWDMKWSPATR
ncbi:hypothetical protein [Pseudomonas sp. KNUC1026]|uniref:hypothetical protein n=1 Tax=Pseudomonas sp. KNUC1026 TaxID=2893890 RepID=UPI001F1E0F82|nr:hypothetical protein LN139_00380 [Pseudomonas sp. KNUC1026]